MKRKYLLPVALLISCHLCNPFSTTANAQEHGAHTHGEADVLIILEGTSLFITLKSPAVNLLGFEHAPHTDKQKQLTKEVVAKLQKAEHFFALTPACVVKNNSVDFPFELENTSTHHESTNGNHTSKEHHHDVSLNVEWECKQTNKLEIDIKIFEEFKGFNSITAQWIAFDRQNAAKLNKHNSVVILEPAQ